MSRPGSLRAWLALILLAGLAGCGESPPGGLPASPPAPWLHFVHPVSGSQIPDGTRFELSGALVPGVSIPSWELPAAESRPDPVPIRYALDDPLPPGLAFNRFTRTLSGTLDPGAEHPPSYRIGYRATAPGHRDAWLSLVLEVDLPLTLRPPDGSETLAFSFPVGTSGVRLLPAAIGGTPPYAYELGAGCEAAWLRHEGRYLYGSPTAAHQHAPPLRCRWQVTDADGGFAWLLFEVSVDPGSGPRLYFEGADGTPLENGGRLEPLGTLVQGTPLPPLLRFPAAQGGTSPRPLIEYRIEVAEGPPGVREPPQGLEFDPVGRILTGTIDDPTWPAGVYRLRYVASASGYADAWLVVRFDLEDPLRLDPDSILPASFPAGEFGKISLPRAKGGAPPYRYSLEQCPLEWLELVGTELAANPRPEHEGERRLCGYRVTDADGTFVELVLDVSSAPDPLRLDADSIPPASFPVGELTRESLPRPLGGTPPYRYTLEQCPFAWLSLVGTELAANPRPEHHGAEHLCGYRVTDADGAFVELELAVSAVVGEGGAPSPLRGRGWDPVRERRLAPAPRDLRPRGAASVAPGPSPCARRRIGPPDRLFAGRGVGAGRVPSGAAGASHRPDPPDPRRNDGRYELGGGYLRAALRRHRDGPGGSLAPGELRARGRRAARLRG